MKGGHHYIRNGRHKRARFRLFKQLFPKLLPFRAAWKPVQPWLITVSDPGATAREEFGLLRWQVNRPRGTLEAKNVQLQSVSVDFASDLNVAATETLTATTTDPFLLGYGYGTHIVSNMYAHAFVAKCKIKLHMTQLPSRMDKAMPSDFLGATGITDHDKYYLPAFFMYQKKLNEAEDADSSAAGNPLPSATNGTNPLMQERYHTKYYPPILSGTRNRTFTFTSKNDMLSTDPNVEISELVANIDRSTTLSDVKEWDAATPTSPIYTEIGWLFQVYNDTSADVAANKLTFLCKPEVIWDIIFFDRDEIRDNVYPYA